MSLTDFEMKGVNPKLARRFDPGVKGQNRFAEMRSTREGTPPMAENKTQATAADPEAYLAAIADESRRKDCTALLALMSQATKAPAVMWGTAIVGFGLHKYPLAGGKQGEICAVGFSSRKADISIYGVADSEDAEALLAQLGKHKRGKGCLYISRMADVDLKVLEKLLTQAFKRKNA